MDPSDQIRHSLSFLFLVVYRWWHAVAHVWARCLVISSNKVCIGRLEWGISGQARLYAVVLLAAAVLPWRGPKAATMETPSVSLNKVCSWAICCCNLLRICLPWLVAGARSLMAVRRPETCTCCWVSEMGFAMVFSASHRCGAEKRRHVVGLWLQIRWRWSSDIDFRATLSAAVACLPTQLAFWWPFSSPATVPGVSATSRWRPSAEIDAALFVFPELSGAVLGADEDGRSLCSLCIGGDRGPNGFLQFLFRVFYVNSRDLSAFMCFCKVLTASIPALLN